VQYLAEHGADVDAKDVVSRNIFFLSSVLFIPISIVHFLLLYFVVVLTAASIIMTMPTIIYPLYLHYSTNTFMLAWPD
jgi:hypothetical protein